jgi:hypothetical protein
MTVVARRVASVPSRTSVQTWQRVVELVAADGSPARAELSSITSAASMLIAEEYAKVAPITISGGGPLVRVYTLHGDAAIEHDIADEPELAFDPTAGEDWTLSLPAEGDDVEIVRAAVNGARHVEVRDVANDTPTAAASAASLDVAAPPAGGLTLDLEELARP